MSKPTMAEIVAAHWSRTAFPGARPFNCLCGKRYNRVADHAEHVADALIEAGYGDLELADSLERWSI